MLFGGNGVRLEKVSILFLVPTMLVDRQDGARQGVPHSPRASFCTLQPNRVFPASMHSLRFGTKNKKQKQTQTVSTECIVYISKDVE